MDFGNLILRNINIRNEHSYRMRNKGPGLYLLRRKATVHAEMIHRRTAPPYTEPFTWAFRTALVIVRNRLCEGLNKVQRSHFRVILDLAAVPGIFQIQLPNPKNVTNPPDHLFRISEPHPRKTGPGASPFTRDYILHLYQPTDQPTAGSTGEMIKLNA